MENHPKQNSLDHSKRYKLIFFYVYLPKLRSCVRNCIFIYRRSGNFRCYNIFVNVRAYENLTHEYFDSHSVSVSTVCRLSFTVKNLCHSSRPNTLVHVVAADTQLSFESLHRNFTPLKKFRKRSALRKFSAMKF